MKEKEQMQWKEENKVEQKFCKTEERDFKKKNQRSSHTSDEQENPQLNKALRNLRQRTKSRKILTEAMKRKRLLSLKKHENKIQM